MGKSRWRGSQKSGVRPRSKPEIFYLKNRNCKGDKFEMKIRKAEKKDIPRILELLGQVLQIHAEIRPDIFYTRYHQIYPLRVDGIIEAGG